MKMEEEEMKEKQMWDKENGECVMQMEKGEA